MKVLKQILPYVIIVIVVLLIKKFIVTPIRVVGPSMKDTLMDGDIMLLDKISYRFNDIDRFDIVVIKYDNELIIKRVLGMPGDTIEVINNKLYINGEVQNEPYLATGTVTDDFSLYESIPDDSYFVLGDNRENSKDSRIIGLVSRDSIVGKAKYAIFPFTRFGNKNIYDM